MDERLAEAAKCGNIDSLYELIQRNPDVLDHIDKKPFANTPFHAASLAGQTQFAKEIMRLKPSFAKKLNEDGFSPMHLALQNGQTRFVLQLLQVDNDLVCIKGREGMTLLHCAAKAGEIHLLVSFLNACPKSIEDVTIRNETALHVALNSGMFEAFKVLVEWLKEGCCKEAHHRERKVLNWKDEEGNSVLHIAASKNIPEALRMLLDCRVDVKSKNLQGLTALDMINGQAQPANSEIIDMMGTSGALAASLFPPVDYFGYYLRLDQWLRGAAQMGDVNALYAIIQEDPYILESIDQVPFHSTPLHIAASAGHTQFALEIMKLKPSFARKLNRDGCSPMHLALQNNRYQTVRRLLDADSHLVRVKGRKGLTPLHYTAEKGMLELLAEFLIACPGSIEDLTVHKESALHIAAKFDSLEALELLLGWLEHAGQNNVLDWKDDEGNTVLHIASQRNQTQEFFIKFTGKLVDDVTMLFLSFFVFYCFVVLSINATMYDMHVVKMLIEPADSPKVLRALFLCWFGPKVDLNAKNSAGSTAVDILQNQEQLNREEITQLQHLAKRTKVPSFPGVSGHADYLRRRISCSEKWAIATYREKFLVSNATRNAVLVVAILIATATYQAVLSPPGGLSQSSPTSFYSFGTFSNGGTGSYANATAPKGSTPNSIKLNGGLIYSAPTSTFQDLLFWTWFITFNTIAFVMSIMKMITLLPNGPFFILPLVIPLLFCYGLSIIYISPETWSLMLGLFAIPTGFFLAKLAVERWIFGRRRLAVKQLLLKQRQEVQKEFQQGSNYGNATARN